MRFNQVIKLGNYTISRDSKVFIIAEAGVNHNGSVKIAKKMVDAAKNAGADAIKFQAFNAKLLVSAFAPKAEYQKNVTDRNETQLEMLKKLELAAGEFKNIAGYAKKKNILFLSSPFDKESVDMLDKIGIKAFKIASGEITNLPLLKYIAGKGRPIILSTGMSNLKEISEALRVIRQEGVKDVILLHCVTSYPACIEDVNLRAIETMRRFFKLPVGFSDHTTGFTASIAAAALGASVIEKHFTLDKNMPGPDHKVSLNPKELKEMITVVRDTENALGDGKKNPTKEEDIIKDIARKKIVAKIDIPRGGFISNDMLDFKRACGKGISPKHIDLVIGRKAKKDIDKDNAIMWNILK